MENNITEGQSWSMPPHYSKIKVKLEALKAELDKPLPKTLQAQSLQKLKQHTKQQSWQHTMLTQLTTLIAQHTQPTMRQSNTNKQNVRKTNDTNNSDLR